MTWALVFNGKIQTQQLDEFVKGFNELIDKTNSEYFGKVEKYQVAEYVEYQKIEETPEITENAEIQDN